MIEKLLPAQVVAVDTVEDWDDAFLFPVELAAIGRAVEKRRLEFTTARACAHRALELLGRSAAAVPRGARGAPRWPEGLVGSITHCAGYRACALAEASAIAAIGIDAEPHAALPDGVLEHIVVARERAWIEARMLRDPGVHWDRLVFSIKETVYKAWSPHCERALGFQDAAITLDIASRSFRAELSAPGLVLGGEHVNALTGRWQVSDGLIVSALAVACSAQARESSPVWHRDDSQ